MIIESGLIILEKSGDNYLGKIIEGRLLNLLINEFSMRWSWIPKHKLKHWIETKQDQSYWRFWCFCDKPIWMWEENP